MKFFASLAPCEACGKTDEDASWNLFGARTGWQLVGRCASCRASRVLRFVTEGDPNAAPCPAGELGDARPSAVIAPAVFLAELLRLEPLAPGNDVLRARAFLCIRELSKFPPEVLGGLATPKGDKISRGWLHARERSLNGAALGATGAPVERITRVLFDEAGPPPTVGALEQALGLRLTDANVSTNARGFVTLAATPLTSLGPDVRSVDMEYAVRRPIATLADLRARPLTKWSIGLRRGYAGIQRAIAGRSGWSAEPVAPDGACTLTYVDRTQRG